MPKIKLDIHPLNWYLSPYKSHEKYDHSGFSTHRDYSFLCFTLTIQKK